MKFKLTLGVVLALSINVYGFAVTNNDGFAVAKLSLESCLERLLESNLEIKSGVISTKLRSEDILIAGEKFQSSIKMKLQHEDDKSPSDFIFEKVVDIKQKNSELNISLQKLWELGTLTTLEWSHSKLETNTSLNKINPGFHDKLNLKVEQPLFQGLGKKIQRIDIEKSKHFQKISELKQRMVEESSILKVSQLYWALSLAREYLKPLKGEIVFAKEIVKNKRALFNLQKITQLEVEESIRDLKTKELATTKAENNVSQINQQLVSEIFPLVSLGGKKGLVIIPTTPFEAKLIKEKIELKNLQYRAFQHRLELKAQAIQIAITDLNLLRAKDKLKSNTSLFASTGLEGLASNSAQAMKENYRGSLPNWNLGLQLSFFLDPVSRKSHWQKAILEKDNFLLIKDNIKSQIVRELVIAMTFERDTELLSKEIDLNIEYQNNLIKRISKEIEVGRNIQLEKNKELVNLNWLKFKKSENKATQWLAQAQILSTQGVLFKHLIREKNLKE